MTAKSEIAPGRMGAETRVTGSTAAPQHRPFRPAEQMANASVSPMIGYVYGDGGRWEAGFKGSAGDCVTRALAILTGRPYRERYRALANANARAGGKRSARNGIRKGAEAEVFQACGLVKVALGKGPRPTYSEAYQQYGDCIVSTTRHLAALVDGAPRYL